MHSYWFPLFIIGIGTYSSLFASDTLVRNPPRPKLPKMVQGINDWKHIGFYDLDNEEIARQLTIADYHLYAEIKVGSIVSLLC